MLGRRLESRETFIAKYVDPLVRVLIDKAEADSFKEEER